MYSIDNGLIKSKKGIPGEPRWFADGRVAFGFSDKGIERLEYFIPRHSDGNATIFLRGLFDSFRFFLCRNRENYSPSYEDITVYPFGLEGIWQAAGQRFAVGVGALEETVYFYAEPLQDLTEDFRFKLHFFHGTQLTPCDSGDYRIYHNGARRQWQQWVYDEAKGGGLSGGFLEISGEEQRRLAMHISASETFTYDEKRTNGCSTLLSGPLRKGERFVYTIAFGDSREAARAKGEAVNSGFDSRLAAQRQRYNAVRGQAPVLRQPDGDLSRFMALTPLYHEALKVLSAPGAVRAKTSRYWVWGWDCLIANPAVFWYGDHELIGNMLLFFEETSHPDKGLAHAYNCANAPASFMAEAAQGMYICLLHHYLAFTGDICFVKARYAFAKEICQRILPMEVKEMGLFKGTSLFPDFPQLMMETGSDLSLYNNSVCYASLRAMECLAFAAGDEEMGRRLQTVTQRTRKYFDQVFFHEGYGFYVNSVDANTLTQRVSFNICGLMWENEFCRELTWKRNKQCMTFIEKHCIGEAGIRTIPLWDPSYDMDANQLHCTWPVVEGYFLQLAAVCGKRAIIEKWAGWVAYWTEKLLCPEGVSYFIETAQPELDSWNAESGTWQAYSMRKWYEDIVTKYLGILPDAGGFTFLQSCTDGYSLEGFHFQQQRIRFTARGNGEWVKEMLINGRRIKGTHKTPLDLLHYAGTAVDIEVIYQEEPVGLMLRYAYGIGIRQYKWSEGRIEMELSGYGTACLTFYSPDGGEAWLDGHKQAVIWDEESREGTIMLDFGGGRRQRIMIARTKSSLDEANKTG